MTLVSCVHSRFQTSSVRDTTNFSFCSFLLFLPVITGKVTAVLPGPSSAKVEVSLIKAYKSGRLNVTKSGPATSVTLTSTCKKCPGLTKGAVGPSNMTRQPFPCPHVSLSPCRPELRVDGKRGRPGQRRPQPVQLHALV